jgi:hypothetical protein
MTETSDSCPAGASPAPEGLASSRVASVAWTSATAAAKRTQRANGPRERFPKLSHRDRPTSLGRRRQHEAHRQGEVHRGRRDHRARHERKGSPGTWEICASPPQSTASAQRRPEPGHAVLSVRTAWSERAPTGIAVPAAESNEAPGRARRSPSLPYERRSRGTELTGTRRSEG